MGERDSVVSRAAKRLVCTGGEVDYADRSTDIGSIREARRAGR